MNYSTDSFLQTFLFLRWYRELRKVGQGYDNYERKNKEYDNMEECFFIECISICLQ